MSNIRSDRHQFCKAQKNLNVLNSTVTTTPWSQNGPVTRQRFHILRCDTLGMKAEIYALHDVVLFVQKCQPDTLKTALL